MFIRKKKVNGTTYFAVVETYRQDGKVRQRQIVALGSDPSIEGAIDAQKCRIKLYEHCAGRHEDHSELAERLQEEKQRLQKMQEFQAKTCSANNRTVGHWHYGNSRLENQYRYSELRSDKR